MTYSGRDAEMNMTFNGTGVFLMKQTLQRLLSCNFYWRQQLLLHSNPPRNKK